MLAGILTMDQGAAIGLLILVAYTVGVFYVETFASRRQFVHISVIGPAFIVVWGGLITRLYLEKRGFNLIIGTVGFAISILGFMYKLCVTAIFEARQSKSKIKIICLYRYSLLYFLKELFSFGPFQM